MLYGLMYSGIKSKKKPHRTCYKVCTENQYRITEALCKMSSVALTSWNRIGSNALPPPSETEGTARHRRSLSGLGIELLGLVTDSKHRMLCSLSATKPNSLMPKPDHYRKRDPREKDYHCNYFVIERERERETESRKTK